MTRTLTPGAVFVADFPEHDPSGHEQQGPRPAILVGLPTNAGRPRFPVLMLAPVTTFRGQPWVAAAPDLYPVLSAGAGGLRVPSVALIDQTRALDAARVSRYLGTLSGEDYAPIHAAVRLIFRV
ncbi:type II toxin-antitoxin system PemK/MazF family toxin [Deinococcus sp. MIMF12]|uniref:Type II toxin-antitoxin system PemK/MazF family toxin n=1 Tax=Deinococcus rhizophilus TaxID=3049544 RepID=A0ABT7JCE5_9DEIO|nr:type II toxin-antitoxin system PemK/MazF family toxin [Deinococcus rhizophilus]MDL2342702.1 type II toxin-antitoxin system PemK/MazF family toxin [Deinococcus rhizophilus]